MRVPEGDDGVKRHALPVGCSHVLQACAVLCCALCVLCVVELLRFCVAALCPCVVRSGQAEE